MEVFFQWIIRFWNELWPFNRVMPWQAGLLVTAGKWTRKLKPGVYLRVPLLMQIDAIDTVEQIVDLPNQVLATTDEKVLVISGAVQYHIDDIKKYFLEVQDPDESLQALAMLEIASFVAHASSDEVTPQTIEDDIAAIVADKARLWGIEISRLGVTHLSEANALYVTGDNTVGAAFFAG